MVTSHYEVYCLGKPKRYRIDTLPDAIKAHAYLTAKSESEYIWQIAQCIKNKVLIDIDEPDKENVRMIVKYYSQLYGKLRVFKTQSGGYHVHTREYSNEWEWHYDCCRVLNPLLETSDILKYLSSIKSFFNDIIETEHRLGWDKKRFLEEVDTRFKKSGLYCGVGRFDILFCILVLLKGYYCVRITKKKDNDVNREIDLSELTD